MKTILLLSTVVAALVAATASTTNKPILDLSSTSSPVDAAPTTAGPKTCVDNCKCTEKFLPGIVKVTQCDKSLTIDNSTFEALNKRVIEIIAFENVIIDEVKNNAFVDFPILEDLVFDSCRIGTIEQKALDVARKVKFTNCKFEDDVDLFAEKMDELAIANSELDEVPNLNNLFVLEYLNLSGNYIKDVDVSVFAQSLDLEELILSDNQIVKLPSTLFVNNDALNLLVLDNNPLKHFYINVSNSIETLSLKNCNLTSFDKRATYKLINLSELNLANNKISDVRGEDFAYMNQLTVLDLSNNSLTKLDSDVFAGNPELQKIELNDNNLETLPSFVLNNGGLFKTHIFSCRNCGLKTLKPDTFKNMHAIVYLDFSKNKFTEVDKLFDLMTSVKILDLSYNEISAVGPNSFARNINLETVNLAGNPLLTIDPTAFIGTTSIKKIDANNCKLYKLWANNKTVLSSLETLIVNNNQLTSLAPEDFKVVPNLEAIDLQNNPLRFDEAMCNLFRYLEKLSIFPIEYTEALANLEESLTNDLHGLSGVDTWSEIYKEKCNQQVMNELGNIEIEESLDDDDEDDDSEDDDEQEEYVLRDDKYDDINIEGNSYLNNELENGSNPYILSITFVFILTALVVLTISVAITLCVMKRRNTFNMQKANLPRFKIPAWEHRLGTKKHSGSVYRPLSEDLSGPKTPKMSRYEFSATPGVHSA